MNASDITPGMEVAFGRSNSYRNEWHRARVIGPGDVTPKYSFEKAKKGTVVQLIDAETGEPSVRHRTNADGDHETYVPKPRAVPNQYIRMPWDQFVAEEKQRKDAAAHAQRIKVDRHTRNMDQWATLLRTLDDREIARPRVAASLDVDETGRVTAPGIGSEPDRKYVPTMVVGTTIEVDVSWLLSLLGAAE